ncbi:MAG: glycine cleavage system aminomethyltransferase GcvT [Woeseiaceae bacterium]|nr:glycine cleavage system aminomethyltransferase GcvT [Woeseiaceae bacterium]
MKTSLYDRHVDAGARIVDFGGWDMPVHYGSQKEEHHAVRRHAGVFDVSHMTIVDLSGDRVRPMLRYVLANDVGKMTRHGAALYSCMLNDDGGVIDDLIAYYFDDSTYRLVVNAATRDKDLAWLRRHAEHYGVRVSERADHAMLAVQGPHARELASPVVDEPWRDQALLLKPFNAMFAGELFVARTGYTGEDGWEIVMPAAVAGTLWDRLVAAGAQPCGLGARDTLRLEAAMNLYGNDMDESTTPLESGLGWTVAWQPDDRDFIGRRALEQQRQQGGLRRFVGLVLEGKGVLRAHQKVVVDGAGEGEITSGGFSPTMERSIALARVPAGDYDRARVDIRGRLLDVRVVKPPFVRNGRVRVEL